MQTLISWQVYNKKEGGKKRERAERKTERVVDSSHVVHKRIRHIAVLNEAHILHGLIGH